MTSRIFELGQTLLGYDVSLPHQNAERCKVPEFAKAMGHESIWKQHNGCL